MKKAISLVLCAAVILSCMVVSAFATTGAPCDDLIVFVTGIGQSYTYSFEKTYLEDGSFENGDLHDYENYTSLIENHQYAERWNLVYNLKDAFKNPVFITGFGLLTVQLFASCITGTNVYSGSLRSTVSAWLAYNTIDENGKLPENVITPQYVCSLSEYPYHIDENGERLRKQRNASIPRFPARRSQRKSWGSVTRIIFTASITAAFPIPRIMFNRFTILLKPSLKPTKSAPKRWCSFP